MKAHTTATNRWLAESLAMGNLHEVSRKAQAWSRSPDPKLARAIGLAPSLLSATRRRPSAPHRVMR